MCVIAVFLSQHELWSLIWKRNNYHWGMSSAAKLCDHIFCVICGGGLRAVKQFWGLSSRYMNNNIINTKPTCTTCYDTAFLFICSALNEELVPIGQYGGSHASKSIANESMVKTRELALVRTSPHWTGPLMLLDEWFSMWGLGRPQVVNHCSRQLVINQTYRQTFFEHMFTAVTWADWINIERY